MAFDEPWQRGLMVALHDMEDIPIEVHGARRLYRSVMERAISDYVKHRDSSEEKIASLSFIAAEDFRTARDWIFEAGVDSTLEKVAMSFPNVCLVLGVPPRGIRKLAENMSKDDLQTWIRAKASVSKSEGAL